MKSILDLAYGVLAGRPEAAPAAKPKLAVRRARNGARAKTGKARSAAGSNTRRSAPAGKRPRAGRPGRQTR